MTNFHQPYIRDELTIGDNCTGAGGRTVSARRPAAAHAILIDPARAPR